jgi:tetratricopeptide (TPR) repeat protein
MDRVRGSWAGFALLLAAAPLGAQQGGAGRRAFELERKGNYAEAAESYRTVLAASPGDVQALFGLERTLLAMNRLGDILPQARAAVAANPRHGPVFGILLRAWSALG